MNAKIVKLLVVPRLSRKCFADGIDVLAVLYPHVMIRPDCLENFYLQMQSFPDDIFTRSVHLWGKYNQQFPNPNDLEQICFDLFPERKFEIDPEGTLSQREKRNALIEKWKSEGRWPL